MIPDFYDGEFLPDGDYITSWEEVHQRFGSCSDRRTSLSLKLKYYLEVAKHCAFVRVYIFGSFISGRQEPEPGDVDLMWVYRANLDLDTLSPECRNLLNYEVMKQREGWDMFCCSDDRTVLDYLLSGWRFTKDKKPRGVVLIELQ